MTPVILRASSVDFVRDGRPILADIDLSVRAGEHWALIGANGAGKSTLLSMLGAVRHPTRGTVEVLGRRLGRVDLRALRGLIGHVNPQHPVRSPLTVRQVVLTGATGTIELMPRWQPSAAERERAEWLIEVLGMAERAEEAWPTLSQGERGRTLIARALLPDPHLLLLDEPTTGLDIAARERLLDRLDWLRERHPDLASVLVTHHLEELPASTTHALLLREGRIVAAGPADRVLTGPLVSQALDYPLALTRVHGRWSVRADRARRGEAPDPAAEGELRGNRGDPWGAAEPEADLRDAGGTRGTQPGGVGDAVELGEAGGTRGTLPGAAEPEAELREAGGTQGTQSGGAEPAVELGEAGGTQSDRLAAADARAGSVRAS